MVAQIVELTEVAVDDFKWQVENTLAGLLIVLLDHVQTSDVALLGKAQEKRQEFMRHLSEKKDRVKWGVRVFGYGAWAFLFGRSRGTDIGELGEKRVDDHI